MGLSQLVYVSRATHPLSRMDVLGLAKFSSVNNKKCGLTGLLLYNHGHFLQLLEGDSEAVDERFARISMDQRHHEIVNLMASDCEKRLFSQWSMGLLNLEEGPELQQLKFTTTIAHLRAAGQSSGQIAIAMMRQFSQQLPVAE